MPVQANRLGAQSCRTRCLQQLGNRQLLVDQVVVVDELCDRKLEAMMAGNDDQAAEARGFARPFRLEQFHHVRANRRDFGHR